jgi:hypothetical protein
MASLNLFTNNASTTLASGINSSVTSLTVAGGTGALFPNPTAGQYFYTTLSNIAGTIIEIVKVTARSTDTFTIVRGQDNTAAASFIAGDKVELRVTAADLNNFSQLDSTNTFAQAQTFTNGVVLGVDLPVSDGGTGASTAATARANLVAAQSGSNTDITALSGLTTPLSAAQGGTGATSLVNAGIDLVTFNTTATAAGTTTLTSTSPSVQFFTGTTTQTIVLPVASTMVLGQRFTIHNNSTGSLTVNSSGANLVGTVTANTTVIVTCISTTGTSAASWDYDVTGFTTALPYQRGGTGLTTLGTANQVLAVNSGATALEFQTVAAGGTGVPPNNIYLTTSGTYTKTTGAKYILFAITGGSGGGGGTYGNAGNAGNASSFSTYATANGGGGGASGSYGANGAGGAAGNLTFGSGVVSLGNGTGVGVRVGIISYATNSSPGGGGGRFDANCFTEGGGNWYGGTGGAGGGTTTAKLDVSSISTIAFTSGNGGTPGNSGNGPYGCPSAGGAGNGNVGSCIITEYFG